MSFGLIQRCFECGTLGAVEAAVSVVVFTKAR